MNNPIDIFTSDVYGTFLCVMFCFWDGAILYLLWKLYQQSKLLTKAIKYGFQYTANVIRYESEKHD